MALIQCKNCGKLISDTAIKCPKCKTEFHKNNKKNIKLNSINFNKKNLILGLGCIILTIIIIGLYYFIWSVPSLESIKDSVVKIEAYDKNGDLIATGSGFCAYKNNYIVTNFHVIEGSYELKIVKDDNSKSKVKSIKIFDSENDLAILEVDAKLNPVKINTNKIKTGQEVTAIGSPKGELNTVSKGIISNSENTKGIQISAAISHGNSGGALFNERHELIGITYAGYDDAQNLNYAIITTYLETLYSAFRDNDFYKITFKNIDSCMATNDGFSGCDGSSKDFYSVANIENLYEITNIKAIYEDGLSRGFYNLYDKYSNEDKELVVATYQELLKYDICLAYTCDIKSKLKKWDQNEFIINLGVLSNKELAFVLVDIKEYNSKDSQFRRVNNDYPIDAAKKSLISYLLGDYLWSDIHKDNKKDIFEFLDKNISNTENLGSVLELLGYDIKYNNDGTLTAYW